MRLSQDSQKVFWSTESFTPLTQHRILIKDVSYFLILLLSQEINNVIQSGSQSKVFLLQHSTYNGATTSWRILTIPSPPTSSHSQHFYYVLTNLTLNSNFSLVVRFRLRLRSPPRLPGSNNYPSGLEMRLAGANSPRSLISTLSMMVS